MNNDLQIFTNEQFGEIRVVEVNHETWFVAADICRALDIQNVTQAVGRLNDDEKAMLNIGLSGGATNCVNEPRLYRLIFASRKPEAEKFQNWVYHDVLPSIRKHGIYATDITIENMIANPDFAIQLLQNLKAERAEKEQLRNIVEVQSVQIAELTPKANYYDLILQSTEAVPISVIAKDYGYSAKAMNKLLNDLNIQYKLASGTWLIYQSYAKEGYTCTKTYALDNGSSRIHTYWTQKGRMFLYDTLKQHGVLPLIERTDLQ